MDSEILATPQPGPRDRRRGSVARRLTVAAIVMAALTLVAAGIAYQGTARIQNRFDHAAGTWIKLRGEGARMVQYSQILAVIARRVVTATNGVDLIRKRKITNSQLDELEMSLSALMDMGIAQDELLKLEEQRKLFIDNLDQIVSQKLRAMVAEEDLGRRLEAVGENYAKTNVVHQALLDSPDSGLVDGQRESYLKAFYLSDRITALLHRAADSKSIKHLGDLKVQVETNLKASEIILASLSESESTAVIRASFQNLGREVTGTAGLIAQKSEILRIDQRINVLLLANDQLVKRFTASIADLSANIETQTERDRMSLLRETRQDRIYLVGTVAAAAIGGFLIFVYVHMVMRRLSRLRDAMISHTQKLESDIPRDGNDEITDMGDALGFFVGEISRLALSDALTGLDNRTTFSRRFSQAVQMARRQKHRFAMVMLDLDKFKPVNDTHGHPVGDAVLQEVAARLKECCRGTDVVARMGGDEFALILTLLEVGNTADIPARRIVERISHPIQVDDLEIHIGTSLGIAYFPTDGESMEELVRRADLALYEAKRAGRSTYRTYETTME